MYLHLKCFYASSLGNGTVTGMICKDCATITPIAPITRVWIDNVVQGGKLCGININTKLRNFHLSPTSI